MAKLTTALLARATKIAVRHAATAALITEAFQERYGCTYSDVDADELIDVLDYGGSEIAPTLAECDAIMAAAGYPAGRAALAQEGGGE